MSAAPRKARFTVIGGAEFETAEGEALRWFIIEVRAPDAATAWQGACDLFVRDQASDATGPIEIHRIAVLAGYHENLMPMDDLLSRWRRAG